MREWTYALMLEVPPISFPHSYQQALKNQIEMVAHATNILAVGLEPRVTTAPTGAVSAGAGGGPAPDPSQLTGAGKERRGPAGAYDRLLRLVGSQDISRKMEHFDPEVLNRMSVKMAAVDALLKSPAFNRNAVAPDIGMRVRWHAWLAYQ